MNTGKLDILANEGVYTSGNIYLGGSGSVLSLGEWGRAYHDGMTTTAGGFIGWAQAGAGGINLFGAVVDADQAFGIWGKSGNDVNKPAHVMAAGNFYVREPGRVTYVVFGNVSQPPPGSAEAVLLGGVGWDGADHVGVFFPEDGGKWDITTLNGGKTDLRVGGTFM